jgi:hypothetical protein
MDSAFWAAVFGGIAGGITGPLTSIVINGIQKQKMQLLSPIEKEVLVRARRNGGSFSVSFIDQVNCGIILIGSWSSYDQNNEQMLIDSMDGLNNLIALGFIDTIDKNFYELSVKGTKKAKALISAGY